MMGHGIPKARRRLKHPGRRTDIPAKRVPYLLAASAILAGIGALQAARYSSEATTAFSASRNEAEVWSAAIEQATEWVFETIARDQVRLIVARTLERELRREASRLRGKAYCALIYRANQHEKTVEFVEKLLSNEDDAYVQSSGPYDFADHLEREISGMTRSRQSSEYIQDVGEDYANRAVGSVSVTIVAALAFLSGALAEAYARIQRTLLYIGSGLLLIGTAGIWLFSRPGFP
jgi:hypothetical protein